MGGLVNVYSHMYFLHLSPSWQTDIWVRTDRPDRWICLSDSKNWLAGRRRSLMGLWDLPFGVGILSSRILLLEHYQDIWKRWKVGTMFQGLTCFKRPKILKFTLFCCIWQNVLIYAPKCSSTAQKRRGGGRFSQFGQTFGYPTHRWTETRDYPIRMMAQ